MKRFLLITMLCVSFFILNAQTIIWTGAGDGTNWSDSNNWDLLHVPTSTNDVIIPDGSSVTINNHVQTKSITVQGNTVMTLNDGISFSEPSLFEENVTVNWHLGRLTNYYTNFGIALTNKGTININRLTPSFNAPEFYGPTFNNEGVVNLINGYLILVGSVANNEATGIIDIQSDDSGIGCGIDGCGTLNNYGVVRKTVGTGESRICTVLQNMGVVEISTGELNFCHYSISNSFNNSAEGIIKGNGAFNITQLASYTNSGTFGPGASVGALTFIGDFTSSDTSKLEVELDGLNQGVDYDLLAIQGDAIFDGIVDVAMGFEGKINDEFIVATTTGTITQCNLATIASSVYNSKTYDFSVQCRNDNEVVLTITNITDGQTLTWIGGGDGINWSDANNWNPFTVPTLADDVIIPDGSTLTINVPASAKSIDVQGFSTLSINERLTFTGDSSFSENSIINWSSGDLAGGGTLTNKGIINIIDGGFSLRSNILNNEGTVNLVSSGILIEFNAVFNNQATGILNMQDSVLSSGMTTLGNINNYGTIKIINNISSGIETDTTNFGTIEVLSGILRLYHLNLNNTHDGTIKGTATIDLSDISNFTNTGTFEPGTSVGTLTVLGDFTSALGSNLKIELNGLTQGSEYDLLAIQGDASFFSYVEIIMGFECNINDEFIIVNTTGTITHCNITSTTTAEFDGDIYDFTVACRNNNEVVLTIANITLGIDSNEFSDSSILLFPNPIHNDFTLRNNSDQNLKSATIMDLNGRIVKEIELIGMEKDKIISLERYSTGLYLIKINSEYNSVTKKIVQL